MYLVHRATDHCKLQQQHHGESTCSCGATVINFISDNFTQGPNKRIPKCKFCDIKIRDAASNQTTSNFIRHVKNNPHQSLGNVKINFSVCEWLGTVLSSAPSPGFAMTVIMVRNLIIHVQLPPFAG